MGEALVEYACQDRITTLTLNRPDRLNAWPIGVRALDALA
jgi:enoyl-CoA hydratase/carnithine racemase